jgi:tryptophanyl-tRNA synthetase
MRSKIDEISSPRFPPIRLITETKIIGKTAIAGMDWQTSKNGSSDSAIFLFRPRKIATGTVHRVTKTKATNIRKNENRRERKNVGIELRSLPKINKRATKRMREAIPRLRELELRELKSTEVGEILNFLVIDKIKEDLEKADFIFE